jgi:four helix bundle protein
MSYYKDLVVWQKSYQLTLEIYKFSKFFPKEEVFGLSSQMRRAAVSVPSNISEGNSRGSRKEYVQFLRIALGSASELETQLLLSKDLNLISLKDYTKMQVLLTEVIKMLSVLIKKLSM